MTNPPWDFPENCVQCGLCRSARSYNVRMDRKGGPPVDLLIVGSVPSEQDDLEGKLFVGEAGRFFRQFLDCWEGSYAITTTVKCHTPQDREPTPEELAACEVFLTTDISQANPKCIILLGGVALKSVWKQGPQSINRARVSPVKLGNTWVLTTYHPTMHTNGRMDLTQEYLRIFDLASKIVAGEFREENPDIRTVQSEQDLVKVVDQISRSLEITLDIETDTHDKVASKRTIYMPDSKLICLGIGTSPEEPVWVIPGRFVSRELIRHLYGKTVIGWNLKYDVQGLSWWYDRNLWEHISIEDPMLLHGSQDQGKAGNGLVECAIKYLGIPDWKRAVWDMVDVEDDRRKKLKLPMTATLADIPFPVVAEMNGRDVMNTIWLLKKFRDRGFEQARPVYRELLLPATQFLGQGVELNGIGASVEIRDAVQSAVENKIAEIQVMLREQPEIQRVEMRVGGTTMTGKPKRVEFSSNSPIHLEHLLVETDIEVIEKTKKAVVTIDGEEVLRSKLDKKILEGLAKEHPIWRMIAKQREYRFLISKFLVPYGEHIAADGRIHCRYNVAKVELSGMSAGAEQAGGTDTGRLAALDPAMHNIKKEALVRMMLRPAPGFLAAEFDYAQIEPRVMAWLADCRALIDACQEGDVYRAMSAQLRKKSLDAVTPGERKIMKQGVLAALLYGQQEESFSVQQGIPLHEVAEFFKSCRQRFPEVPEFQQEVIRAARRGDEIETVVGRVSTFGDMYLDGNSPHAFRHNAHIDIKAVNFTVQSPASDINLIQAMRAYRKWRNNLLRFVNLVHDSQWPEIAIEAAEWVLAEHKALMEDLSHLPFHVPVLLPVSVKVGRDFGECLSDDNEWKPGQKVVLAA